MTRFPCAVVLSYMFSLYKLSHSVGYELYDYYKGPKGWCYHSPNCTFPHWKHHCQNRLQSPINLPGNFSYANAELVEFSKSQYTLNSLIVRWKGITVQLEITNDPKPTFDWKGAVYKLHSVHFHVGDKDQRGSEHTVDLKSFPMEVHFVYYNKVYPSVLHAIKANSTDAFVTIAVFVGFRPSASETTLFKNLQEELHRIGSYANSFQENVGTGEWQNKKWMQDFFPAQHGFAYTYTGSMTTPPCSTITWLVMRKPIFVEEKDIEELRNFQKRFPPFPDPNTPNNFRPLQSSYSREIGFVKLVYK